MSHGLNGGDVLHHVITGLIVGGGLVFVASSGVLRLERGPPRWQRALAGVGPAILFGFIIGSGRTLRMGP